MAEVELYKIEFIGSDGEKTALVGDEDTYQVIRGMVARDELPEQDAPKKTKVDDAPSAKEVAAAKVHQHGATPAEVDTTGEKPPAGNASKEKWQGWLASRGIPFDPTLEVKELKTIWEESRQSTAPVK